MDLHNVPTVMDGDIDRLLDALIQDDQARRLANLGGRDRPVVSDQITAGHRPHGDPRAQARPAVPADSDAFGDLKTDERGLGLYTGTPGCCRGSSCVSTAIGRCVLRTGAGGGYACTIQMTNPDLARNPLEKGGPDRDARTPVPRHRPRAARVGRRPRGPRARPQLHDAPGAVRADARAWTPISRTSSRCEGCVARRAASEHPRAWMPMA